MNQADLIAALDRAIAQARKDAPRPTLLDTIPCEGCSAETPDPLECEHDRNLCPDCVAEGKCAKCREVHHALSNWRLG